jgi:F-type H+-transporting ATPase subunit alpha
MRDVHIAIPAYRPSSHPFDATLDPPTIQNTEARYTVERGARLDDQTRRVLEHGQRIRACLKQPQSQAVTVQEQIVVLLALTAGLFDQVPLERMVEAEKAVRTVASQLTTEIFRWLTASEELKKEERDVILAIAKTSVAQFEPGI